LFVFACTALVLPGATAGAQPPALDPDVAQGIKLVEDGEYDGAILTLDRAARRLAQDPKKLRDASQAYLYLGIAYIGKGQEAAAKARFREALQQAGDLTLSPEKFPPKVINLFEAAKAEVAQASVPPGPAPATAAPSTPTAKKGGSKVVPLILGGVAAAAGGVALAAGGGGSGSATTAAQPAADTRQLMAIGPEVLLLTQRNKEWDVNTRAAGTLEALLNWSETTAVLIVYLYDATTIEQLASAGPGAVGITTAQISAAVQANRRYRLGVVHNTSNSSFQSRSNGTFTLQVKVP
jgi:tetratricopeptide (TPR) repeat protein